MTIHPHQGINGHAVSAPKYRSAHRAALSAAFSLVMKDLQAAGDAHKAAGDALKSAEQRAQEFQTALALLDEEDPEEEDKKEPFSVACRADRDTGPSADPAPTEKEPLEKEPFQPEEKGSFQPEEPEILPQTEKGTSRPEEPEILFPTEKGSFQPEAPWNPPFQPSGPRKSFAYALIGERSGFISGWFGKAGQKALSVMVDNSSRADARLMLEQIADSVESGDIRWAGQTFASHTVHLRWLFPYLPAKFAGDRNPSAFARLKPDLDLFRQLNELCRERTRKDHETTLKSGYPAFHRSKKDEEELDRFAQQWWNEQMRSRMAQAPAAKPLPEKAAAPAAPIRTPEEAHAIAMDQSRWTSMDDMPIVYHGVTLWPPEPDKINPISRTDAEIAYWLAFEYLVEVRRLRGKNPRVDAMDLRQKFKYLKKIPECDGVLRGLHIIAGIVNNDIGDDRQNRIPRFEITMV